MRVTLGPKQLAALMGIVVLQGTLLFFMCVYVLQNTGPGIQGRLEEMQNQIDALRVSAGRNLDHYAIEEQAVSPEQERASTKADDRKKSLQTKEFEGYFEHDSWYIPRSKESVILVMTKTSCSECNFQGWSDNCVFVHSLRRTGYTGDVVFFLNNINDRIAQEFKKYNISYILMKGRYMLDGYNLEEAGLGQVSREKVLELHSSVFRYLLYDVFLRDYGDHYNYVMFTDVRDVLFQLDPFVWDEHPAWGQIGDKLYAFAEDVQNSAGWNFDMYKQVYGRTPPRQVASKNVLCSGTTIASIAKARIYLSVMLPELGRVPNHLFGYDQAIHNHIIYTGMIPESYVHIFPNRQGPVRTVGLEGSLPDLVDGKILLPDGSVVNIVHQWTRIHKYDDGSIKKVYDCPLQSVGY